MVQVRKGTSKKPVRVKGRARLLWVMYCLSAVLSSTAEAKFRFSFLCGLPEGWGGGGESRRMSPNCGAF